MNTDMRLTLEDGTSSGRTTFSWPDNVKKTIWLTRPDLRELCGGDPERFEWWLAVDGAHEYAALREVPFLPHESVLTTPAEEALFGDFPTLTRATKMVWALRPDLQATFDLSTLDGQRDYGWWIVTEGVKLSALMERVALAACARLMSSPAAQALPEVSPPLTRFMMFIRGYRPDVQAAFDLSRPDDQQNFVWWYLLHAPKEHGVARYFSEEQRRFLNAPYVPSAHADAWPLTRLMHETRLRRQDLVERFPLATREERATYAAWFYATEFGELGMLDLLDPTSAAALNAPMAGLGIPVILAMIWTADPAVRSKFNDLGSASFLDWGRSADARRNFPILEHLDRSLQPSAIPRPCGPAILSSRHLPVGVNLVGYARGQLGVGEEVRMAALAMQAARIPFTIYSVNTGDQACQGDTSVDSLVSDDLPYSINMYCLPGMDMANMAALHGRRLFDGRRSIGVWPWELQEWPRAWSHAFDLVDEVWASTRYSYEAFVKSSPKPVSHQLMPVVADGSAGLLRRDLGLPEGRFLFTFSFDVLSSLSRKNPKACIAAFRRAFPRGDEPVGLVVKAMRGGGGNENWLELLRVAEEDRRITIINRTLRKQEVLDLYRACDCFVSLHRAEGFGRGIAEAMILGKPVIVTGFSGNLDFTTPGTAALVDYRLKPVAEGEYPFGTGQLWAEPDVDHAAWWMRRMVADTEIRERLASEGCRTTTATYSPSNVGRHYAAVLGLSAL